MNRAFLVLGSNIKPAKNIPCAVNYLRNHPDLEIKGVSSVWQTKPVGTNSSDFYNVAVEVETRLDAQILKQQIIGEIEHSLKRVRLKDKYAPRTIDIDIAIFNNLVMDDNLYKHDYLILPLAEIIPEFEVPEKSSLGVIASEIFPSSGAKRLEGLLEKRAIWPC